MAQDKAEILRAIDEGVIPRLRDHLGSGDIELSRVYGKRYKITEYTGRKIDIVPLGWGGGDSSTRREDTFDNRFVIVVHERYTDANDVPDSWMDERMLFTEVDIFDILTSTRDPFVVEIGSGPETVFYWIEFAEVTVAFDFTMYDRHKVFWSEIEVTLSRLK